MGHHRRLATNRQRCRNHHCRLEPWTNSVGLLNTAGLSHEPTVISSSALPVWAMNRQCCLDQHCLLQPSTDSVGLLNTAGLGQEPTVLSWSTLPAWAIIRQCWLDLHCRFGQEPTPLKQTSLSVGTTNRQCYSTRHCRVEPRTDTIVCSSVSVFKNRQWCQPHITAGMPLSVQNPAVKGVFEPAVMYRSGVVQFSHLMLASVITLVFQPLMMASWFPMGRSFNLIF